MLHSIVKEMLSEFREEINNRAKLLCGKQVTVFDEKRGKEKLFKPMEVKETGPRGRR